MIVVKMGQHHEIQVVDTEAPKSADTQPEAVPGIAGIDQHFAAVRHLNQMAVSRTFAGGDIDHRPASESLWTQGCRFSQIGTQDGQQQ